MDFSKVFPPTSCICTAKNAGFSSSTFARNSSTHGKRSLSGYKDKTAQISYIYFKLFHNKKFCFLSSFDEEVISPNFKIQLKNL